MNKLFLTIFLTSTCFANLRFLTPFPASTALTPFIPSSISGQKLWLDATSGTQLYTDTGCSTNVVSDGDNVKCWKDLSTNTYNLTEATHPPVYKVAQINSKAIVRFNGTNSTLSNSANPGIIGTANPTTNTTFTIFKTPSISTNSTDWFTNNLIIGDFATGSGGFYSQYLKSGTPSVGWGNFTGLTPANPAIDTAITTGTYYLFQERLEGGNIFVRVNNGAETSTPSGQIPTTNNGLRMGNESLYAPTSFTNMDVAHLLAYNNAVLPGSRLAIATYLNNLYGFYTNPALYNTQSLVFNGTDTVPTAGDNFVLDYPSLGQALTFSVWIKVADTAKRSILSREKFTSPFNGYDFIFSNGGFAGLYFNGAGLFTTDTLWVESAVAITPNVWTHVVASYDGSGTVAGINIYYNGVAQAKTINNNNLSTSVTGQSIPFDVGSALGANFYKGNMNNLAIFNRAYNASDITTYLEATGIGSGIVPADISTAPGLLHWWQMANNNQSPIDTASLLYDRAPVPDQVPLTVSGTGAINGDAPYPQ